MTPLEARAFNAILPALRQAGEWLPLSARRAVAEAVVAELKPELDALDALREVARGYCPHCGRGDAAPTVADWEQQKQRADHAEAEIAACRRQAWPQQLARTEEALKAAQRVARGIGAWGVLQAIDEALHAAPAATQTTDDYEQTTGHEITCTAGFTDICDCERPA